MDASHRRVMMASAVGSALEWYDFFIYGTAAALVFSDLFFPKVDPTTGLLLSFATFGVGFFARPFGGMVFGHLGDRIGRKPVLVITLMLVGVGTFLIGLLPTYESVGIWAPIMLVFLRLVQGFGAGAEYGGAVILAVEHAPPGRRGLFGSFAAIGVNIGLLLATGVFALVTQLPQEDFLAWGWRIPFLLSVILIVVGFYIRARVSETPVFSQIAAKSKAARSPVKEAFARHPREFLVVLGARLAENGLGYLYPVFTLSYMTKQLGLSKSMVLNGIMLAYAISLLTVPMFSALSDRIGRRPVYGGAAVFSALFAYPFFLMVGTGSQPIIWLALILAISVGNSGMFGPQAAYFAEMFGAKLRYSGFATAREIGSLLAGGPAPFLATLLLSWGTGQPWYVAGYMVALAVITAIAIYFGPETYKIDIGAGDVADAPGR
ncbi:MAG TPA: MFS transporter [Burkholderiales bacterium]|jgi:MHS family shikimate/dehydroshikimate transporter-like MFS transporter